MVVVFLIAAGRVSTYGQAPGSAGDPAAPNHPRVRAADPALSTLLRQATDQSATFRRLVAEIQTSDGIVHVMRGRCGHSVRACLLLWMGAAGPNRMLRIVVESDKTDIETMASLGHELRHVLEVLAEPNVRTGPGMFQLYKRNGAVQGVTFETEAAIEAGDAVYLELKRSLKN
ncbi:MAG: hypothetical protein C5B46_04245 [Proteobacteria bacterium]|nr:MAG: hypothetical protein C5B46_04245 [Pseudomonadota bacterium]